MAVPKRTRYEVFRRDNYTCRYCGAKAPDVEITIDHIVPRVLGGSDTDPANLVTACRPCNSGKTSSSPDAPLVAAASDDAVRWSAAMKAASARMLADINGRQADRDQFREWWNSWNIGEGKDRQAIPMAPDWESTVSQLLGAGLPLPVLKDCINSAMRRNKVTHENRFRYMCGIAWNKVGELRRTAEGIASGSIPETAPGAGVSPYEQGRLDFARELLDEMTDEERAYFLDSADWSEWQDEDDEPLTETDIACSAVSTALNAARCNVDWLVTRVKQTLEDLPDGLGEHCLEQAGERGTASDPLSRAAIGASGALYALVDLIDLPASVAFMKELPEEEAAEWVKFAEALYPHAKLSDERWIARAADSARVVKAGNHYHVMCTAPGEHIPDCPARGTHYAKIADLECCERDNPDHRGHLVCDRHLEQLVDGTYVARNGKTRIAVDFTEAKAAVPFLCRAPRPASSRPSGRTRTS